MDLKTFTINLFVFIGLLLIPKASMAIYGQTYTWIAQSGLWSSQGNWLPDDGPPISGDKAIIEKSPGVTVTSNSGASINELTLGSGNILRISSGGLSITAADTFIANNGIIHVQSVDSGGANISTWGANLALQGNGAIVLGGDSKDSLTNNGWGGTVTNTSTHTIQGGGEIHVTLINEGQVIADNGMLNFTQSTITNTGSTMSASGAGNTLGFLACNVSGGQINPQNGKVYMLGSTISDITFGQGLVEVDAPSVGTASCTWNEGVTLSAGTTVSILKNLAIGPWSGHTIIINNGAIRMQGAGCKLYGPNHLILEGSGSLVMEGDGNNNLLTYDITISALHTIEGAGLIQTAIYGDGAVIARNGTLTLEYGRIIGNGTVSVADNATLLLTGYTEVSVQTGDMTMSHQANLTVGYGIPIELKGSFSFAQIDPAKWNWDNSALLKMSGQGPVQTLEVGGSDYGLSEDGLTNNFALPKLQVANSATMAVLVDSINNGHRAINNKEALYVNTLQVLPGATLNLNNIKLYTYLEGVLHRVSAGEGNLFGGGQIIDDNTINMTDVVLALQIMAGITPGGAVYIKVDVNNDGKIGLEEALYALQVISGIRTQP